MALPTSSALCLLGILICGSFLGAEAWSCARGWMQSQGNCYAYFDEQLTWAEAEIDCQSYGRGAHLVSVLTKAETDLLARFITRYQKSHSDVWIGLHDVRQNGKWRWSDGASYKYRAWRRNEPNNLDNSEYCVELTTYTAFKEWNDESCDKHNAYICKYEM
ncbi:C-type lectin BpLec-like [Tiliqua scincoides]|uniref:C-type lectin BpLec-like n=1 Tax=Tiliqua scincoides TaxID=71010 RepID=UPI0034636B89